MSDSVITNPAEGFGVIDWRRDDGWTTLESLLGISATTAGQRVTFEEAIRQDAVLACVDVIQRDLSKVDLQMVEFMDNGGSRIMRAGEHWLANLLALDPNEEHTWRDFVSMIAIHLTLTNNVYIYPVKNRMGQVTELIPIIPGRVQIVYSPETNEKIYLISRGNMHEQSMLSDVPFYVFGNDLIHIRRRIVDGLHGLSTLNVGGPTIALAKAIRDYQRRLYDNDGQSRLYFEQNPDMKPLSNEAFLRMKSELRGAAESSTRNGIPFLLEPGYSAKMLALSAADTQLKDSVEGQIVAIARLFGIPPHKIGHAGEAKYQNMEVFERLYAQDVLIPAAQAVESGLGRSLFTPKERTKFGIRFNRRQMEIVDYKIRAEVLKVGMQHMAVTADEFREAVGLNPLPNGAGNVRFAQSTMTVVGENNEVLIPAGSKGEEDVDDPDDETTEDSETTDPEDKQARTHLRVIES